MQAEHLRPLRFSDVLAKLVKRGSEVRYVPNRGNAGDALIAAATGHVLKQLRITERPGAPTILVAGGGGLVSHYQCMARTLRGLDRQQRVVIGPSTVNDHWELLRSFPNLTLMCRDEMTLRLARMNRVTCVFAHDAAFDYPFPETVGEGVLTSIRTDAEAAAPSVEGNVNLSEAFTGRCHLSSSDRPAAAFVAAVGRYEVVRTNWLHVAIAAARMGRMVEIGANSYYKNRAVFQSSLSRFPKVSWVDNLTGD